MPCFLIQGLVESVVSVQPHLSVSKLQAKPVGIGGVGVGGAAVVEPEKTGVWGQLSMPSRKTRSSKLENPLELIMILVC